MLCFELITYLGPRTIAIAGRTAAVWGTIDQEQHSLHRTLPKIHQDHITLTTRINLSLELETPIRDWLSQKYMMARHGIVMVDHRVFVHMPSAALRHT